MCSTRALRNPREVDKLARELDDVDRHLIAHRRRSPKTSVSQLARSTGLARGTVQARLDRLEADGVIVGYGPDLDRSLVGYGVLAFVTLEIAQGAHVRAVSGLAEIDEVLEVHTVTGPGDLLCRVVARSNDHLHDVLQAVVAIDAVERSETHLALTTQFERTVADLLS